MWGNKKYNYPISAIILHNTSYRFSDNTIHCVHNYFYDIHSKKPMLYNGNPSWLNNNDNGIRKWYSCIITLYERDYIKLHFTKQQGIYLEWDVIKNIPHL